MFSTLKVPRPCRPLSSIVKQLLTAVTYVHIGLNAGTEYVTGCLAMCKSIQLCVRTQLQTWKVHVLSMLRLNAQLEIPKMLIWYMLRLNAHLDTWNMHMPFMLCLNAWHGCSAQGHTTELHITCILNMEIRNSCPGFSPRSPRPFEIKMFKPCDDHLITRNYTTDEQNFPKGTLEFSVVFIRFTPDTVILLEVAATLSHVTPISYLRITYIRGAQTFQRSRRHIEILDARRATQSKFQY